VNAPLHFEVSGVAAAVGVGVDEVAEEPAAVLVAVFGGVALYRTPRARSLSPYPVRATFVPTSLEAEGRPFDRDPPGTLRAGRMSSRPSTRGVPCPSASPPR
jgi:hypothetical protein